MRFANLLKVDSHPVKTKLLVIRILYTPYYCIMLRLMMLRVVCFVSLIHRVGPESRCAFVVANNEYRILGKVHIR